MNLVVLQLVSASSLLVLIGPLFQTLDLADERELPRCSLQVDFVTKSAKGSTSATDINFTSTSSVCYSPPLITFILLTISLVGVYL
jgi:hypothetical protein